MSMYSIAVGVNVLADSWISILRLTPDAVGRLRDAWLQDDGEHGLRIVVHTRNGGGNRGDFEAAFEKMRAHPQYIQDFDCDFDSTYANIEFRIPEGMMANVSTLLSVADEEGKRGEVVDNRTQRERWDAAIAKI